MLELHNITKTYRTGTMETPVLKGISLTIFDGEFVAIMGPSGSGKSTLMNIIGCLDSPTSGAYFLDGKDVATLSDDALAEIRRTHIGFVFQSFYLLARTSVLRNVMLPLVYAGVAPKERDVRARSALSSAAFPEGFWEYKSNQLSGGMMQRVAIARALVNNPTLVLADEPTGNLDTKTGEAVLETFQRLHADEKRTIVLITHERYVAEHAERIITLRDGLVVQDETNRSRRISTNGTH